MKLYSKVQDFHDVTHKGYVDETIKNAVLNAAIQVTTMPTAAQTELGKVYQYIGVTDSNYTNGYFYQCVVVPNSDPVAYEWVEKAVTNYERLEDKPQINGVTLTGNKSTADLSIVEPWVGTAAEYAQQSASIPAGTPIIITDDDYTAPCYFDDTTGELYVNGVKILAVMDEASYEALATKSNIWYATYPTPTPSLSMGGAKSSGNEEEIEELKEPETKKNAEIEISDEQLEKLPPFGFGGYDE